MSFQKKFLASLRDIIFGVDDGMVSTLGALVGVAIGSQRQQTVVLAGLVIISVESISTSIGSYLSSKSARRAELNKLAPERRRLRQHHNKTAPRLKRLYQRAGWSTKLATMMAKEAVAKPRLYLKEVAYRQHRVIMGGSDHAVGNGLFMLFSYIIGGLVPLLAYLFWPINVAIISSLLITLTALFVLGALTSLLTGQNWWRSGWEMLGLASVAVITGYLVGRFF